MKALVTGGNGFLGSHLVHRLVKAGWSVACLVRPGSSLRWIEDLPVELVLARWTEGDGDNGKIAAALKGTDCIFHAAAVLAASNDRVFDKANVAATERLLKLAVDNAPALKRFVYVSSIAVARPAEQGKPLTEEGPCEPVSGYGRSKLKAERLVMGYGDRLPVTAFRAPPIYGPRDRGFFDLIKAVNRGICPILGFKPREINMVHVSDVVALCLLLAEKDAAVGEVFYVGGKENITYDTVTRTIAKALGKRTLTIRIPIPLMYGVALFPHIKGKLTGRMGLLNLDKVREMNQPSWALSIEKARRLLGYQPEIGLDEGLAEAVDWYRREGWLS